jgi:hypothetical protein
VSMVASVTRDVYLGAVSVPRSLRRIALALLLATCLAALIAVGTLALRVHSTSAASPFIVDVTPDPGTIGPGGG